MYTLQAVESLLSAFQKEPTLEKLRDSLRELAQDKSLKLSEDARKRLLELTVPENEEDLIEVLNAIKDSLNPIDDEVYYKEVEDDLFEEEKISPYGFKNDPDALKCYRAIKPLVTLCNLLEVPDEDNQQPNLWAYKLAVAFGDEKAVKEYLENYFKANHQTNQPMMHDATLFNLPASEHWKLKLWRDMAQKQMQNGTFRKAFAFADKIENFADPLQSATRGTPFQPETKGEPETKGLPVASKEADLKATAFLEKTVQAKVDFAIEEERKRVQKQIDQKLDKIKNKTIDEYISEQVNNTEAQLKTRKNRIEESLTKVNKDIAAESKPSEKLLKKRDELTKSSISSEFIEKEVTATKAKALEEYNAIKLIAVDPKAYLDQQLAKFKQKQNIPLLKTEIYQSYQQPLTTLTPEQLFNIAISIGYARANENPVAAEMLIPMGITENLFDEFLTLKPANSDAYLPPIVVDGAQYGVKGYYVVKLSDDDPKAAFLGYPTGCCQSLGSEGAACAKYGVEKPNSGFYVMVKGKIPDPLPKNTTDWINPKDIVAETWAWRNIYSDIIVFDNIEAAPAVSKTQEQKNKIKVLFTAAAMNIGDSIHAKSHPVKSVQIGKSANISTVGYGSKIAVEKLQDYSGYSDASQQTILYDANAPIYAKMLISPVAVLKDIKTNQKILTNTDLSLLFEQLIKSNDCTIEVFREFMQDISHAPNVNVFFEKNYDPLLRLGLDHPNPKFLETILDAAKQSGADMKLFFEPNGPYYPNFILNSILSKNFNKFEIIITAALDARIDFNKVFNQGQKSNATNLNEKLHYAILGNQQMLSRLFQLARDQNIDLNAAVFLSDTNNNVLLDAAKADNLDLLVELLKENNIDIQKLILLEYWDSYNIIKLMLNNPAAIQYIKPIVEMIKKEGGDLYTLLKGISNNETFYDNHKREYDSEVIQYLDNEFNNTLNMQLINDPINIIVKLKQKSKLLLKVDFTSLYKSYLTNTIDGLSQAEDLLKLMSQFPNQYQKMLDTINPAFEILSAAINAKDVTLLRRILKSPNFTNIPWKDIFLNLSIPKYSDNTGELILFDTMQSHDTEVFDLIISAAKTMNIDMTSFFTPKSEDYNPWIRAVENGDVAFFNNLVKQTALYEVNINSYFNRKQRPGLRVGSLLNASIKNLEMLQAVFAFLKSNHIDISVAFKNPNNNFLKYAKDEQADLKVIQYIVQQIKEEGLDLLPLFADNSEGENLLDIGETDTIEYLQSEYDAAVIRQSNLSASEKALPSGKPITILRDQKGTTVGKEELSKTRSPRNQ